MYAEQKLCDTLKGRAKTTKDNLMIFMSFCRAVTSKSSGVTKPDETDGVQCILYPFNGTVV